MKQPIRRRSFLGAAGLGLTGVAFSGLRSYAQSGEPLSSRIIEPLGPLLEDPGKLIDLPAGFTYGVIARQGKPMSDGHISPGLPDGMAAFEGPDGKLVLVRNHELALKKAALGPFGDVKKLPNGFDPALCFDAGEGQERPHMGGTSNIVFDPATGKAESSFLSLLGTDRNCAGGAMPWGSWITCEEPEDLTTERGQKHGWCFEVKATDKPGVQAPVPIKTLGRFRHEAVALDPRTQLLYLTEDRNEGLLYRFVPDKPVQSPANFSSGKLQALVVTGKPSADLRNYLPNSPFPKPGESMSVEWMDLEDIETPKDNLRFRGFEAGAARFARGEGIHWVGDAFYICCTDGGPKRRGQIWKLTPSGDPAKADELELFIEPEIHDLLVNGDNLCPAPWGGIVVCEDLIDKSFAPCAHVRCVTPEGKIHTLVRNRKPGEFAGCCFSPDGKWFFVNVMSTGMTFAITGPWQNA